MTNAARPAPGGRGQIRPARPDDAMAVGRVHVDGWRETYPGIVPGRVLARMDAVERARYWAHQIRRPAVDGTLFVAEAEGEVVGFGMCGAEQVGLSGYGGEYQALYLLRRAQGFGFGRGLMAAMTVMLLRQARPSATVWTLKQNRRARGFYEHLGGTLIAERPLDFDGTPVMEVAYGWPDIAPLATCLRK